MIIPITSNYYDDEIKLFMYDKLELQPGITSLVGCNGAGKSTLLHQIKEYAVHNNLLWIDYNDRTQGHSNLMDKMAFEERYADLANMFMSSEGERNYIGVGSFFRVIGAKTTQCLREDIKDLIVLLDATDSGMSVDNIEEVRDALLDTVIPDAVSKDLNLYVVVAANNYEWACDARLHLINVITGEPLQNLTYEDWKKQIYFTRASKDIRDD